MNVKKFIKKIQESDSFKKFKDEMDESSMTGMVAGYDSPKAFAPPGHGAAKASFDKKTKKNAEQFGYKIVEKGKRKNSIGYEEFANNAIKKPVGKGINESSISTGISLVDISDMFIDDTDEDNDEQRPHPTMMKTVKSAGYTPVYGPKTVKQSVYKVAMKALKESSYKDYKRDKTRTTNEKINHSIKELNHALLQIERAVNHATRLKTEMAVDQRTLWSSSHNRLVKIGERLNRIGKKINELGA